MPDTDPADSYSTTRRAALAAVAGTASLGVVGTAAAASSVELYLFGTQQYADNVENHETSYKSHMEEVETSIREYWSEIEEGDDYQLETFVLDYNAYLVPESELGSYLWNRRQDGNEWIHDILGDGDNPEVCHLLDWNRSDDYLGFAPGIGSAEFEDYTRGDDVDNTSISRVDGEYVGYPLERQEEYYASVDESSHATHEIFHQFGARHSDGGTIHGGYGTVMLGSDASEEDGHCEDLWVSEPERAAELVSSCTRSAVRGTIDAGTGN